MNKTLAIVSIIAIGISIACFYAFKSPANERGKYIKIAVVGNGSYTIYDSKGEIETVNGNACSTEMKLLEKYNAIGYKLVGSLPTSSASWGNMSQYILRK